MKKKTEEKVEVITQAEAVEEPTVVDEQTTEEVSEEVTGEQPVVVEEQIVPDVEEEEVAAQEEGEITENTSAQEVSDMPVTEEQSVATSPAPESIPQSDAAPESAVESEAAIEAALIEKEREEEEAQAEAHNQVVQEDSSSVSAAQEAIDWPASSDLQEQTA